MTPDREWLAAHPDRWYRLREPAERENPWAVATYGDKNLRPAMLIRVLAGRRTWSTHSILVFGEIVDNDEAAMFAHERWDNVIYPRLFEAKQRRLAGESE